VAAVVGGVVAASKLLPLRAGARPQQSPEKDASGGEGKSKLKEGGVTDGKEGEAAAVEEDLEAAFERLLAESKEEEQRRVAEDKAAEELVAAFVAQVATTTTATAAAAGKGHKANCKKSAAAATATAAAPPGFGWGSGSVADHQQGGLGSVLYNPARDGDCLMRCAVAHDFGVGEGPVAEPAGGGGVAGGEDPGGGARGRGRGKGKKTASASYLATTPSSKKSSGGPQPVSPPPPPSPQPSPPSPAAAGKSSMTADVLRRLVVGRVREANLALLQEEIMVLEAELKKTGLAAAEWVAAAAPESAQSAEQGAEVFVMVGQKKGGGTPGSGKAVAGKWGGGVQGGGGLLKKESQQSHQVEHKDKDKPEKPEKEAGEDPAEEEEEEEEEEETPFVKYTRLDEALTSLRNLGELEVKAKCDLMARPGVGMGEDELQALADVRGACVQVTCFYRGGGGTLCGVFIEGCFCCAGVLEGNERHFFFKDQITERITNDCVSLSQHAGPNGGVRARELRLRREPGREELLPALRLVQRRGIPGHAP